MSLEGFWLQFCTGQGKLLPVWASRWDSKSFSMVKYFPHKAQWNLYWIDMLGWGICEIRINKRFVTCSIPWSRTCSKVHYVTWIYQEKAMGKGILHVSTSTYLSCWTYFEHLVRRNTRFYWKITFSFKTHVKLYKFSLAPWIWAPGCAHACLLGITTLVQLHPVIHIIKYMHFFFLYRSQW